MAGLLYSTGGEAPFVSTGSLPPPELVQAIVTEAFECYRSNTEQTNSDVVPADLFVSSLACP